jgi:uncharacterized protein (TIGR02217 family)
MSSAIFPSLPGLQWGIRKRPKFRTKIQQAVGGRELRAAFQPYPIWRWRLSYEFLRTYTAASGTPYTELQSLLGFFLARQGAFDTFLYSDPSDKTVTLQSIGTGTGALTTFQLARTYGGFTEPIYNVDATSAAPLIYKNGVLQTLTTDYTISSTGLVTFVVAPANGLAITWTGSYYWRVRFDGDDTEFSQFVENFWENHDLSFISVLGA